MSQPPPYPPAGGQPGYPPYPGGDPGMPGGFVAPPGGAPGYPPAAQQGYPPPQQGYPPQQPQQNYAPPPAMPIQEQPKQMEMAPPPGGNPNCPPGLEYLTQVDQLIVKQKIEILEIFSGCETKNKYKIKNSMGQDVYKAKEETDCCTRQCCGPLRPFDMTIKDNMDREVIHLYRPLNCDNPCFPCCLQTMEISSPPGTTIGSVEQEWTFCIPQFRVLDASGQIIFRIEGPFCTYSICGDVEFKVLTADGSTEIGKISKQWSGVLREAFSDSDNFGISFPMDLDVKMKATLLGALFLIDFMFFEKKGNEESDGVGMF